MIIRFFTALVVMIAFTACGANSPNTKAGASGKYAFEAPAGWAIRFNALEDMSDRYIQSQMSDRFSNMLSVNLRNKSEDTVCVVNIADIVDFEEEYLHVYVNASDRYTENNNYSIRRTFIDGDRGVREANWYQNLRGKQYFGASKIEIQRNTLIIIECLSDMPWKDYAILEQIYAGVKKRDPNPRLETDPS